MIKIQKLFIIITTFVSLSINGQNDIVSKDGVGFNSVFQNLKSGNFNGSINGILILKDSGGKEKLLDFQGSDAELTIERDEHEVYDVSFKKYIGKTTSGKTEIIYTTYAYANSIEIQLNNETYLLNLIDGSCDLAINGLEYSYESEETSEYLIIRITQDIELMNSYESKIRKSIIVLPNSTLVFAIKRE